MRAMGTLGREDDPGAVVVAVVNLLELNVSTDARRWCGDRHGVQSDTRAGRPSLQTDCKRAQPQTPE